MKHLINEINTLPTLPDILVQKYALDEIIIFDIETLGLKRERDPIILIGTVTFTESSTVVEQFFCTSSSIKEETEMLTLFFNRMEGKKLMISYNGNAFDIPYVNVRSKVLGLNQQLTKAMSLDLLPMIRKYGRHLGMENHKLKTVERYLGIYRKDEISGKDSVLLYQQYEYNKDQELENKILLHNYEDILYLKDVVSIVSHFETDQVLHYLPTYFRNLPDQYRGWLSDVRFKNDFLTLILTLHRSFDTEIHHSEKGWLIEGHPELNELHLKLPLLHDRQISYIDINRITDQEIWSHIPDNERISLAVKIGDALLYFNVIAFLEENLEYFVKSVHLLKA